MGGLLCELVFVRSCPGLMGSASLPGSGLQPSLPSGFFFSNHLILHTARAQGYSKVMMGDSCTRLAVKLLTNLSLGRGASLAMDTVSAGRSWVGVTGYPDCTISPLVLVLPGCCARGKGGWGKAPGPALPALPGPWRQ